MQLLKSLRLLNIVPLLLLTASCANLPQKLEVVTTPSKIERQIHVKPAGVVAPEVTIIVATPDTTAVLNLQVIDGITQEYAMFCYSEKDYLSFSQWLQDLLRYIKAQNSIIKAYEDEARFHNLK